MILPIFLLSMILGSELGSKVFSKAQDHQNIDPFLRVLTQIFKEREAEDPLHDSLESPAHMKFPYQFPPLKQGIISPVETYDPGWLKFGIGRLMNNVADGNVGFPISEATSGNVGFHSDPGNDPSFYQNELEDPSGDMVMDKRQLKYQKNYPFLGRFHRSSARRPKACRFGTFGLVCWNALLRKNRIHGLF